MCPMSSSFSEWRMWVIIQHASALILRESVLPPHSGVSNDLGCDEVDCSPDPALKRIEPYIGVHAQVNAEEFVTHKKIGTRLAIM